MMPATINGGGDQLARGAVRVTFRSAQVSQERWDSIFGADSGPKLNVSKEPDEQKTKRVRKPKANKSA
jgi:hypothetical protein